MRRGSIDSAPLMRGNGRTGPPQPDAPRSCKPVPNTGGPSTARGRVARRPMKVDPRLVRGAVHCRESPEQWGPWLERERARRPAYMSALERAYLAAPWPLDVTEIEDGGYRLLGDGHHRTAMAVCAGLKEIPVEVFYRR